MSFLNEVANVIYLLELDLESVWFLLRERAEAIELTIGFGV
jgi:hypothetical protein